MLNVGETVGNPVMNDDTENEIRNREDGRNSGRIVESRKIEAMSETRGIHSKSAIAVERRKPIQSSEVQLLTMTETRRVNPESRGQSTFNRK